MKEVREVSVEEGRDTSAEKVFMVNSSRAVRVSQASLKTGLCSY